jgi:DNA-binding transcriptional ArsR family regulator
MIINSYIYHMSIVRTPISTEKLEMVAFVLKTIGHPTRIGIIELLKYSERLSVNEICEGLGGLDQSLVSHHLSNMKLKGVLNSRREGRNIYYSLRLKEVLSVIDCVESCDIRL